MEYFFVGFVFVAIFLTFGYTAMAVKCLRNGFVGFLEAVVVMSIIILMWAGLYFANPFIG